MVRTSWKQGCLSMICLSLGCAPPAGMENGTTSAAPSSGTEHAVEQPFAQAISAGRTARPHGGTVKDPPAAGPASVSARSAARPRPPGSTVVAGGTRGTGTPPAKFAAPATEASGGGGGGAASASAAPGVPTCSRSVIPHTGTVIAAPRVSRVFWGSWNSITANIYDYFWDLMARTPAFYLRVSEYGIGVGSSGTRVDWQLGATGSLAETTITAGLTSALTNFGITPAAGEVFVIFLPSGTNSARDVANGWAGHHDHYTATINSVSYNVRYAVIEPGTDVHYVFPVVSHELMEAFSDPDLDSWYEDGTIAEIGDICRFAPAPGGYAWIRTVPVETVWSQVGCRCVAERDLNAVDFYASGSPMPTLFRPSEATWYGYGAVPWWVWGASTDIPYAGDYDGDGRTEFALFRDGTPANIFTLDVATGSGRTNTFGTTGDVPVPGDYDGDGVTDLAVWRPSDGTWNISYYAGGTATQQWGLSTDIPVPGDYDGDHKTDYAVLRPSDGNWYVIPSSAPASAYWAHWVGTDGDIPVPGDYDSDGFTDFAFWRPSDGTFYVWYNVSGFAYTQPWGQSGDIPVVQDYDGDWFTDLAVWRPSDGNWYFLYSSTGGTGTLNWGAAGDIPIQRSVLR